MPPPAVQRLAKELERLAVDVYASHAIVFDAWGLVWCAGPSLEGNSQAILLTQIKTVLEGLSKPLARGGKLDALYGTLVPVLYCRSFASVYVLALWTSKSTVEFLMRKAVRDALPKIEALTVALPPPGGSDPNAGAQHGRA